MFHHTAHHIFRPDGTKEKIDTVLKVPAKDTWSKSLSNKWSRLTQGNIYGVRSTDTIDFIHCHGVPRDRDVAYATFVLNYKPLKDEKHRVRIIMGGDCITYLYDAGSPSANLNKAKVLLNSTISDAKHSAQFMSADIKDYFLVTPMARAEFTKFPSRHIAVYIMRKYDLHNKVTSYNYIYIRIKKSMYILKQAAILAYKHLKATLDPYGYTPVIITVSLRKQNMHPTNFCLCVDNFGIEYFSKPNTKHLLDVIVRTYS